MGGEGLFQTTGGGINQIGSIIRLPALYTFHSCEFPKRFKNVIPYVQCQPILKYPDFEHDFLCDYFQNLQPSQVLENPFLIAILHFPHSMLLLSY